MSADAVAGARSTSATRKSQGRRLNMSQDSRATAFSDRHRRGQFETQVRALERRPPIDRRDTLPSHGFSADRRAGAAAPDGPRVRRSRDRSARDGVGRGAAVPDGAAAEARRPRADGHPVPRRVRRRGMSAVDYCICIEELARVDPAVALSVAAHNGLCSAHICDVRQPRSRRPGTCRGSCAARCWGAWGLTEASAGSDAAGMRTTASRQGDGWVLNGSKTLHHPRPRSAA